MAAAWDMFASGAGGTARPAHLRIRSNDGGWGPGRARRGCGFDPTRPNPARVYEYLLGGKDNFAADREAAARLMEALPDAARVAKANRAFLAAAVRYVASRGIDQ